VIARGSANHPVPSTSRARAAAADIDVQLQAAGTRTGTDADAFYTVQGGVPSLNVSIPNRYMHTPVEVVDIADPMPSPISSAIADGAGDATPFAVDV